VVLNAVPLSTLAGIMILLYCAYFGTVEIAGVLRVRPPGSQWQVPKSFVYGTSPRRRVIIWGTILGPGFFTRNPFAGFAMLPIGVAMFGDLKLGALVAGAIGVAHATGRAVALLRDARKRDQADYLEAIIASMFWRKFDGAALLAVACLLLITQSPL
jgi:hypothetical protein